MWVYVCVWVFGFVCAQKKKGRSQEQRTKHKAQHNTSKPTATGEWVGGWRVQTWVAAGRDVLAAVLRLVPVEDAANKRRDECHASLSAGHSLGKGEEEGEVAVDAVFLLENTCSLDALPRGAELDEHALLVNASRLVQRNQLQRLGNLCILVKGEPVKGGKTSGVGGGMCVCANVVYKQLQERKEGSTHTHTHAHIHTHMHTHTNTLPGIHFGGDTAWHKLEDLAAKVDKELVRGQGDLLIKVPAVVFGVLDGVINNSLFIHSRKGKRNKMPMRA